MIVLLRLLAVVVVSLFAVLTPCDTILSRARKYPLSPGSLDQHPSRSLSSSQLQDRTAIRLLNTELTLNTPSRPSDQTAPISLHKRLTPQQQQALHRFRYLSISLIYMNSRSQSITNDMMGIGPSRSIAALKDMYSNVRSAAINEWAKLPEQSLVRIVCKQLILIILPPADRTVPWTLVEEIASTLFIMTAAGMGGLVTGWYPTIISTTVAWFYLAVIAPV